MGSVSLSKGMFKSTVPQATVGLAGVAILSFTQGVSGSLCYRNSLGREGVPHLFKQTTANGLGPLLINESQDYMEYKVGETDPSPEALNTVNSITQGPLSVQDFSEPLIC